MSIVYPKLLYSNKNHCNISVWEIITESKRRIYYERTHREGLIPLGARSSRMDAEGSIISIYDVVRCDPKKPPAVLKENQGYIAPDSWYAVDPRFPGGSDENDTSSASETALLAVEAMRLYNNPVDGDSSSDFEF